MKSWGTGVEMLSSLPYHGDMSDNLRIGGIEDRLAVEAIVNAAYAPYVRRIGRESGPMLDDYGTLIRGGHVWVVDHDSMLQGIVVLIPEADAMLLDNVAVAPAAQGTGPGRTMLAFAEREARGAGYRSIRLIHERGHDGEHRALHPDWLP